MTGPVIIGAGMAGLIAASMLRGQFDGILEVQSSLPNNHAALLRFRSGVVGEATGIPFRPVRVMKAVHNPENPVKDAINYSRKVLGSPAIRSITSAQGVVETRWIAPDDFIARLGRQSEGKIAFNAGFGLQEHIRLGMPHVISTMPMSSLMNLLQYPEREGLEFKSRKGWVITCDLPGVDICATLYYPQPNDPQYRASVTGSKLIIEGVDKSPLDDQLVLRNVLMHFGLLGLADPSTLKRKEQPYAKILPIPDHLRKRFIMWASERYNIHSLGRFATWRPGLMLDDIVNDVRVIQGIISGASSHPYNARK